MDLLTWNALQSHRLESEHPHTSATEVSSQMPNQNRVHLDYQSCSCVHFYVPHPYLKYYVSKYQQ